MSFTGSASAMRTRNPATREYNTTTMQPHMINDELIRIFGAVTKQDDRDKYQTLSTNILFLIRHAAGTSEIDAEHVTLLRTDAYNDSGWVVEHKLAVVMRQEGDGKLLHVVVGVAAMDPKGLFALLKRRVDQLVNAILYSGVPARGGGEKM